MQNKNKQILIRNIRKEKLVKIVNKIKKEEMELQTLLKACDNLRMDAALITSFLWNWSFFDFNYTEY